MVPSRPPQAPHTSHPLPTPPLLTPTSPAALPLSNPHHPSAPATPLLSSLLLSQSTQHINKPSARSLLASSRLAGLAPLRRLSDRTPDEDALIAGRSHRWAAPPTPPIPSSSRTGAGTGEWSIRRPMASPRGEMPRKEVKVPKALRMTPASASGVEEPGKKRKGGIGRDGKGKKKVGKSPLATPVREEPGSEDESEVDDEGKENDNERGRGRRRGRTESKKLTPSSDREKMRRQVGLAPLSPKSDSNTSTPASTPKKTKEEEVRKIEIDREGKVNPYFPVD